MWKRHSGVRKYFVGATTKKLRYGKDSLSNLSLAVGCKHQLLSFKCDLEAGHDGFHHDGTTRLSVHAYWPAKMAPVLEIEEAGLPTGGAASGTDHRRGGHVAITRI